MRSLVTVDLGYAWLQVKAGPMLCAAIAMSATVVAAPAATHADVAKPTTISEVGGGAAYLPLGRAEGVLPGAKVTVGQRSYAVIDVTEHTAMVRAPYGTLAVGTRAMVMTAATAGGQVERMPAPPSASTWFEQWPASARPAASQHPKAVPLGTSARAGGPLQLTIIGGAQVAAAKGGEQATVAEARMVAAFEPWRETPLGFDADVALRWFGDGYDAGARTAVLVRTAQVRWGDARQPSAALGRLRWAATAVGPLDGGRVAVRAGAWRASAFGGVVPDPLGGRFTTDAARFGGELQFEAATHAWAPSLAVSLTGSTWRGTLDEQRLSAQFAASNAGTQVAAWAEAQRFAADNPWGAQALELTGAGAAVRVRRGKLDASVDATLLRPERSLRLAAALGRDWLCARETLPGDTVGRCLGGDYWLSATGSTGWSSARWAFAASGSAAQTVSLISQTMLTGMLRGQWQWRPARQLWVATYGTRGAFVESLAGEIGVRHALRTRADLALRYRPEILSFTAALSTMTQHWVTADARVAVTPTTDLGLEAGATAGGDRTMGYAMATLVWRAMP